MPTQLLQDYDQGNFETDPSTWGPSSVDTNFTVVRSSDITAQKGFYTGKSSLDILPIDNYNILLKLSLVGKLPIGQDYSITAYVRTESTNLQGTNDCVFGFYAVNASSDQSGDVQILSNVNKTVLQATDTWTEIEINFRTLTDTIDIFIIVTNDDHPVFNYAGSGTVNSNEFTYIDNIEYLESLSQPPGAPTDYDEIVFSKNPIYHIVSENAAVSGNDNYSTVERLDIKNYIGDFYFSGTVVKSRLTASINNDAIYQINKVIDSALIPNPPENTDTNFKRIDDVAKLVTLESGHVYDQLVEPASYNLDKTLLVIKGGVETVKFISSDFFVDVLPVTKQFLTLSSTTKIVNVDQQEFLYFIFIENDTTTQLKLIVNITYEDTTTYSGEVLNNGVDYISVTNGLKGVLWQIPAGVEQLSINTIDPLKIIDSYTLHLVDQDDNLVSEVRTYTVRQCPEANTRYFLYSNSLGGYDTLATTGKQSKTLQTSMQEFESILPPDYTLNNKQRQTFDKSSIDTFTQSTGFLSKIEADRIAHELHLAEDVRIIIDGKRIPVKITSSTAEIFEDDILLYFVRFTYTIAYRNYAYSTGV